MAGFYPESLQERCCTAVGYNRGVTRLIINADDFGLTPGINAAVLELGGSGAVTSATLMATAPECTAAAAGASAQPLLGVGCHVVLLDGLPALGGNQIPTLVSSDGIHFRRTLGAFVRDLHLGRIDDAHIEAEATAQIRRLQALGISVTHVDTHKHTHMFPRVLRPLIRAAMVCGVKAMRNPFEPRWSIDLTRGASTLRKLQLRILNMQRRTFLMLAQQAGMKTTDGTLGILATGSLNETTLRILLEELSRLPQARADASDKNPERDSQRTYELCCHPGYPDAALESVQTRLRHSREIEVDALHGAFADNMSNIHRIHYGQI